MMPTVPVICWAHIGRLFRVLRLLIFRSHRRMDVGSARSDGENTITDPIILALMGKG